RGGGGRPPPPSRLRGPVPAGAPPPWYRLGFAQMHAYGMRESGAERAVVPGVTIRRGGPGGIETAIRIDRLIHDAKAATPSFSSETFDADVHRRNWEETLDGGDVRYLL